MDRWFSPGISDSVPSKNTETPVSVPVRDTCCMLHYNCLKINDYAGNRQTEHQLFGHTVHINSFASYVALVTRTHIQNIQTQNMNIRIVCSFIWSTFELMGLGPFTSTSYKTLPLVICQTGAKVKALASHACDPGSILGVVT